MCFFFASMQRVGSKVHNRVLSNWSLAEELTSIFSFYRCGLTPSVLVSLSWHFLQQFSQTHSSLLNGSSLISSNDELILRNVGS
jgi:hypothetical protein